MIKKVYLISVFSGFLTLVSAQTTIGISAGYLASNQSISNLDAGSVRVYASWWDNARSRYISGFSVGPYASTLLSKKIQIKSSMIYAQKGQEEFLDGGGNGGDGIFKDRISYLMLPLELTFTNRPNKKNAMFWRFGLYVSRGISGSTSYTLKEDRSSTWGYSPGDFEEGEVYFKKEITRREDYENMDLIVKPWDMGGILGLGFKFDKIPVSFTYQFGLLNVHPEIEQIRLYSLDLESNEREKRNNSFCLTIEVPVWSD